MAKIPQGVKNKVKQLIKDGVIDRETVKKIKQANPARKIEFEVGDAKQDDFFPQFKTKHWDNECNFSARLVAGQGAVGDNNGKLAYYTDELTARFYEKDTGDEDGGFEFDVVLPKKPKSNVIKWTLQHKNLDFFYQPELTQEEIDQGSERPENVVGSYAVYHKTKKGNRVGDKEYRTGKAFHIYRPYAEDAEGRRVWCDLHIDSEANEMTVTIPQKALNNAVYPVVVDPTFGYNTAGGSSYGWGASEEMHGSYHTSPSDVDTIDSLHLYTGAGFIGYVKGVLVLESTKNIVSNGIGSGVAGNHSTPAWRTSTLTGASVSASTNYVLMGIGDATGVIYYDTGVSGDGFADSSNTYATPSNPTDGSDNNRLYSIYATYTASGGGGPSTNAVQAGHLQQLGGFM